MSESSVEIQRNEHSHAGGVEAKKVFIFDNAGNQITSFGGSLSGGTIDMVRNIADILDGTGNSIMDAANDAMRVNVVAGSTSQVTVFQGGGPWTALASIINQVDVLPKSNITVSIPSGVTVFQGSTPWRSLGTVTLGAAGATVFAVVNSSLGVGNSIVTVANVPLTTGHNITGIGHGVKTITLAGTDEALAGSTACKKVDIQAQTDNTGLISVGGSSVDATEATGTGIILYPGDVYSLEIDNLADIFIDATVSGEGVRYCYYV